jgi:hypothetical protein
VTLSGSLAVGLKFRVGGGVRACGHHSSEVARRTVHPSIATARFMLLTTALLSAWLIWLVIAAPSLTLIYIGAAGVLGVSLILRRSAGGSSNAPRDQPPLVAWIPVVCVIVAFLGYGTALGLVDRHYKAKQFHAFDVRLDSVEKRLRLAATKLAVELKTLKVELAVRRRRHATLDVRELAELIRFEKELSRIKNNPEQLPASIARARLRRGSLAYVTARGLVLFREERVTLPREPSETELPPWFGRLGGFFTVSTQLLAGLTAVLAFGRWRGGVSEALWRSAMPVAAAGVVFGLAGTLPSLSRALQAVFLAPVLAGLAAAVGGLAVAAMESRASEG